MQFKKTKTYTNLARSFAGESQAGMRYQLIAKLAIAEEYPVLADVVRTIAKNETYHAKTFYDTLIQKEDKTEERVMTYKKFKKLADHLIEGRDRSRLILESAPEKLYSAGIAAVVAKTLFKRFGAKEIRISSRGVKEGYLQLILENRLQGSYYDFARQSYVLCEEQQTSADGSQGSRRKRAAKSMKPADKKSETAQKKTVGAGKKTASKNVASKQKKATENLQEDMKADTQE